MAKILIVEDHLATKELIEMVLRPRGHEVIHTADGSQAFILAKQMQPDLILLDVMLPGMDGYAIQTKLLENDETRSIPIIVMTSKGQMSDVFSLASNVHAFVEKPFSVKELTEKVEKILPKQTL